MSILKSLIRGACRAIRIDKVVHILEDLSESIAVERLSKKVGALINYVNQGSGGLTIVGNPFRFSIDKTSHLKSGTFIDCSGGVYIGRYFHPGRGLTIFSTNHNWRSNDLIPYDSHDIDRPVRIGDAVWFGANVTLAPGAEVGDGVIVSTGSVVFGKIPRCSIVRGNPAVVIGNRDSEEFDRLYNEGHFY